MKTSSSRHCNRQDSSLPRPEPRQTIFEALIAPSSHRDTAFIDDSVGELRQGQDENLCGGWTTAPHGKTMGIRHPALPPPLSTQHRLVCVSVAIEKRLPGRHGRELRRESTVSTYRLISHGGEGKSGSR